MVYRKGYKKPAKKTTLPAGLKNAVKAIAKKTCDKTQEMRYFDYRVTAEQVLNNALSNSSVSYYSDPCDVPLFSSAAATSMEGRTGNQIDIRRIRWAGRFKINATSVTQLRLRFVAIRFATSAGAAPSVGKITLNSTTVATNYLEPIAPDTPYQILVDKRVTFTPPTSGIHYRDVVLDIKTPASQRRMVTYSDTSTTIDYTSVMKGLIRIYWFQDNSTLTSTDYSITSSQMRTLFKDN